MEKEVNDRLDIVATTTQRVNKLLEIAVECALFQMTRNNSNQLLRFIIYYL